MQSEITWNVLSNSTTKLPPYFWIHYSYVSVGSVSVSQRTQWFIIVRSMLLTSPLTASRLNIHYIVAISNPTISIPTISIPTVSLPTISIPTISIQTPPRFFVSVCNNLGLELLVANLGSFLSSGFNGRFVPLESPARHAWVSDAAPRRLRHFIPRTSWT